MINIRDKTRLIVQIAFMTAITIGLSFVRIPFYPVPFTLQTLAAMLAGILMKRWAGVTSQIFYIVLGLVGLPIFSQGGGLGYIFNPTFGYIIFLPVLTLLVSLLYKKLKIAGVLLPAIMLLLFGTCYYILFFNNPMDKQLLTIFTGFMFIFIPAEVLKAISAYFLGTKLKAILNL